tara:strand:- start:1830 stop:2498 length:669 start_codon:yes stop_codon:yes gene_type:complete
MDEGRLLLGIAIFAVGISVLAAGVTYLSVENLTQKLSGYVTVGEANLTVETLAQVNFTEWSVNWTSGRVSPGSVSASLFTEGTGTVTGGNWTAASGLLVENIGNVNVSLNFTVSQNASEMIGGSFVAGKTPIFEWNLSDGDTESNSCTNIAGNANSATMDVYKAANTTVATGYNSALAVGCAVFRFEAANDLVRIDFNITIPEDSLTGKRGNTITATATALA